MLAKRTILGVLVVLLVLVAWLVVFPPEASRIYMNQRRTVKNIGDLTSAEQNYAARHPEAGYACELSKLGEEGLVNAVLASGTKDGYRFEIQCVGGASQKITGYTALAVPVKPGTTGEYALCSDQSGEIWYGKIGLPSDCLANRKTIESKYR